MRKQTGIDGFDAVGGRSPCRAAASRRHVLLGLAAAFTAGSIHISTAARAQTGEKPLSVVATTGMIADAIRQIGGSRVAVAQLMGTGVDPHLYRQTRADIVAMSRADAVFWHGLRLEAQLEGFLADLTRRKAVHAIGEAVPVDRRLAHEAYKDRFDPHVWMDPLLWTYVIARGAEILSVLVPAGKAEFEANAARLQKALEQLAHYAREVLGAIPAERRILVTAHDAFGYFGRAYGFQVEGIQGISTESEAGLRRIEDLVTLVTERRISAIFIESSVSDRNITALVEGARARGHMVRIGGELFSDSMGPEGTHEGTYLGMIDHNITTISRALGGSAPLAGAFGKLTTRG